MDDVIKKINTMYFYIKLNSLTFIYVPKQIVMFKTNGSMIISKPPVSSQPLCITFILIHINYEL